MKKWYSAALACLLLLSILIPALLTGNSASASGTKLLLTPSMVTNECGFGDATLLVDEQTIAGDPANSTGGSPTTNWQPGYGSSTYPCSAYIDLGTTFDLTGIYLRDTNNSSNLTISVGSPGNWTVLFTDTLPTYETWREHLVSEQTQYVRVTKASSNSNMTEIVMYGSEVTTSGKVNLSPSMVTNECGYGDATLLVDEQTVAGDPATGNGGSPSTNWLPGYGSTPYPCSAYVDLGQNYDLDAIYLRDTANNSNITISTGSPGNWAVLFTDPLTSYNNWNEHLISEQTRYIRVTEASSNTNMTEIVVYGSATGGGGSDTIAPAAITSLSAGTATASSVSLSWSSPGDDGSTGTVTGYDVRYSTSAITSGNWSSATQASGEPSPAVAGTGQSMNVSGLAASTTYYFAIKSSDEVANISDLSNVVTKATTASVSPVKLTLTPSMVLNESTNGDATLLVDEQTLAGDPANNNGGVPVNKWFPGFGPSWIYPANAIIDLGAVYDISDIHYFHISGSSGSISFATGEPFDWNNAFTDTSGGYQMWKEHTFNEQARFIRVTLGNSNTNISEIVVYGTFVGDVAPPPPTPTPHTLPTMDEFIGVNAFIDDPVDKIAVAGFVREYHVWDWDEGDRDPSYPGYPNNLNAWNPSKAGGGSWNFDAFYTNLQNAGITIAPVMQQNVMWLMDVPDANKLDTKPVSTGEDPEDPATYIEHADHMFQYAARYGSTTVADNLLKLQSNQPRSTGLDKIKYYESWNEQDKYWKTRDDYFTPYEYSAMLSADYDGHMDTLGTTVGVKNADPNAKVSIGGLSSVNMEYIRSMKLWADYHRNGDFPADVLNIHHYSNDGASQTLGNIGISPEDDNMRGKLEELVQYRNLYLPGKEVWITEFGYDVNEHSPQRSPAIGSTSALEVQGQWITRSYLALAAAGVDKAAMFMLRDTNPNAWGRFQSSGLVGVKGDWTPKPSWYYVYTMKNRLTSMRYLDEQSSGNSNVMVYKFKNASGNNGAYVVWAPTSNNMIVNNYQLNLSGSPSSAQLVTMASGDTDGVETNLTISSGKVTVNVSERPIFIMVNSIN